jgi:hypothetical protein
MKALSGDAVVPASAVPGVVNLLQQTMTAWGGLFFVALVPTSKVWSKRGIVRVALTAKASFGRVGRVRKALMGKWVRVAGWLRPCCRQEVGRGGESSWVRCINFFPNSAPRHMLALGCPHRDMAPYSWSRR